MGRTNAMARYREMGYELQQLRENAGLSGADLAQRMGWSHAKIGRVELGQSEISIVDMIEYLGHCEIYRAQALDLLAKCRDAEACSHGYWFTPGLPDGTYSLIYHETTAATSTCYEPQTIPGLLQTESYIRAITAERWPEWDLDFAVRVRMERQEILHRRRPGQFTFFISEQALRLRVGAAVMEEQLLALTLLDALPHVTIRVVPALATFGGTFRLFTFAQHRPLVYLDANVVGGFFLEDKDYVAAYTALTSTIADSALDEERSREFMAGLAYDHDRVEEKQL
jgi:transcriptional regulator with XRE-family HTH domain